MNDENDGFSSGPWAIFLFSVTNDWRDRISNGPKGRVVGGSERRSLCGPSVEQNRPLA